MRCIREAVSRVGIAWAVWVLLGGTAWSQSVSNGPAAGVQFEEAHQTLLRADEARDGERLEQAVELYDNAFRLYTGLSQFYPHWQPDVVQFRITYSASQAAALRKKIGSTNAVPAVALGPDAELPPLGGETEGRSANAVPAPRVAVELDALQTTAKLFLRNGNPAKARELLLDGLRRDPDSVPLRLLMGTAQCEASNFNDVIYLAGQLVEDAPENPQAHVILGTAYFALGRLTQAREALEMALTKRPELPEAHYDLARVILAVTNDLPGARQHYQRSLELGGAPDKDIEERLKGDREEAPMPPLPPQ
jgi:tetratricopeptide (TPR) repeat protein